MFVTLLSIFGWSLFALAILIGLALDLLGLFGNWIILGAIGVAALFSGFGHFAGWTIPILFGLAVLGEVLEAGAAGVGAAKFGGGRGTVISSLIGCMLGAVFGTPVFPIIGTLIGACLGAFLGATAYEFFKSERQMHEAAWIGLGAALGKVAGLFLKTFVGIAMLITAALFF